MPTTSPSRSDRIRQIIVTVSYIACFIGTLYGIGLLGGTEVQNSSSGVFAATATLIAPAVRAFSIWSVIYTGLLAYVVWQWLPQNATSSRARSTANLAVWSMLLNAAWLFVTQAGWVWVSVLVILALAVDLGLLLLKLVADPAKTWSDKLIVDGTFGAYFGWVSVASIANVAAALVGSGMAPTGATAEILTVIMLAVAIALGVAVAVISKGRIAYALALGWGLSWIAVGRLTTEPGSTLVGVAAAIAAVAVVAAAVVVKLRPRAAAADWAI